MDHAKLIAYGALIAACAVCAYQVGRLDGRQDMLRQVMMVQEQCDIAIQRVLDLSSDPTRAGGTHDDTAVAAAAGRPTMLLP